MYEELRSMTETNEKYRADVKVDILIDSKDVFIDSEGDAQITYNLDIEYREYGIHGILPVLSGDATVSYVERTEDMESEVDKEISVDLFNIKIDWVEGDGFYPVSLTLYINKDNVIDYDKSYLEFAYYKP